VGHSPLSSLNACFVEWLVEEYGAGAGMRVSGNVRHGWRDLVGLVFPVGAGSSVSSSSSMSSPPLTNPSHPSKVRRSNNHEQKERRDEQKDSPSSYERQMGGEVRRR
jgi:hypothetical protein